MGKAPVKPTATESVAVGADGTVTPIEPPRIPKAALSEPVQVEKAHPENVPKKGSTRVVATFVTDGDSFYFNGGRTPAYECRLDVVDTPEVAHPKQGKPKQAYGDEAASYLKAMIEKKEVDIHISGKDHNGRNICQVEINGKDVDLDLVKSGMGWLYRKYASPGSERYRELMSAEMDARQNKRGLWKDPDPEYPAHFRKRIN